MVLFKKLWHKVGIIYSLITIILFLIFIVVFKSIFLGFFEEEQYPVYFEAINRIEEFVESRDKVTYVDLENFIQKDNILEDLNILIADSHKNLILGDKSYYNLLQNYDIHTYIGEGMIIEYTSSLGERDFFLLKKEYKKIEGTIYLIKEVDEYVMFYLKVEKVAILLGVLLSILFMVLSFITSRWLLNPIFEILHDVKNIKIEGSNDLLKEKYSEEELKKIVQLQNGFIIKIRNYIKMEKKFISNASHELLTPVTIIKGYTEILRWGSDDKDILNSALDSIEKETERMENLMKSLMILSKLEDTKHSILIPLDINKIVQEEGKRLEEIYQRNIKIRSEKSIILGEDQLLRLLLGEVIKNAIKYSEDDINIKLYNSKERVILVIEDRGEGISPTYLDEVFQRFSQEDNSKKSEGFGLGLALIKDICTLHQGTIDIKSIQKEGTEVKIAFPKIKKV